MKVTQTSQIRPLPGDATAQPGRVTDGDPRTAPDKVSTEETAKVAAAVAQASQATGAARSARLQAIEAAVKEGAYRPNPQRIAQQILEDAELAARLQALLSR